MQTFFLTYYHSPLLQIIFHTYHWYTREYSVDDYLIHANTLYFNLLIVIKLVRGKLAAE